MEGYFGNPTLRAGYSHTIERMEKSGRLKIRQAMQRDIDTVVDILGEAARWLENRGMAMWQENELSPEVIAAEVNSGLFFLAEWDGEPAGTIRYQLEDPLFWPEVKRHDSAFIHRLAVRRRFAGGDVSSALILWSISHTQKLNRRFLRLDSEVFRPRLRAIYERIGFRFHSYKQVGPYHVARYEFDLLEISLSNKR